MTHPLAPKTPYPDFVAQAWEDKALHHSLKEYVYEADIQNPDGEKTSGEVLEFDTDSEAIVWCENYLKNRAGSIELYRVPFVNESHMNTHALWPDDVQHVARIESQVKNSDDESDALRLTIYPPRQPPSNSMNRAPCYVSLMWARCLLCGIVILSGFVRVDASSDLDFNSVIPSDRELINTFHNYPSALERLRIIKIAALRAAAESGKSGARNNGEENRLIAQVPHLLGVGGDYSGTIRFVFAMSETMAVGPDWAKGIEYVPGTSQGVGELKSGLDDVSGFPPGVYLREIEPHWFVFYQRDE